MRLMLALPILAATGLMAGAAMAQTAPAPATPAVAPSDGPLVSVNRGAPPPPAAGQTPALLTAAPDSPLDGWLPDTGKDKRIHGQMSVGIDSRGGYNISGEASGPIGDNAWMGIAVSQTKWRW